MLSDFQQKALQNLVFNCGALHKKDRVLVVSDTETKEIGDLIEEVVKGESASVSHLVIEPLKNHASEPPPFIADAMQESSLIFGLTSKSMAHTQSRKAATDKGARYLSLPDYTLDIFSRPSLLENFQNYTAVCDYLASVLTRGKQLVLSTSAGTRLTCDISGRRGNSAPGWVYESGSLASPPDIEVNVAPLENLSEGTIIVDGSIPYPGLNILNSPISLEVERGMVINFHGDKSDIIRSAFKKVGMPNATVIAEIGIGLNPKAELSGHMLEDEGVYGTVHVGIGSNATIGGENSVPIHIDHIVRNATVIVDGVVVLADGSLNTQLIPNHIDCEMLQKASSR